MDGRRATRRLPELSNFYCLPGRAGGSPLVISGHRRACSALIGQLLTPGRRLRGRCSAPWRFPRRRGPGPSVRAPLPCLLRRAARVDASGLPVSRSNRHCLRRFCRCPAAAVLSAHGGRREKVERSERAWPGLLLSRPARSPPDAGKRFRLTSRPPKSVILDESECCLPPRRFRRELKICRPARRGYLRKGARPSAGGHEGVGNVARHRRSSGRDVVRRHL
jgi:hypothetical protein